MSKKIECVNVPAGTELVDYYTNKPFKTMNGIAFLHNGNPVSQEMAYASGWEFSKDFKYPVLKTRQAVTEWLSESLKIPRTSETYQKLYKELASDIPNTKPVYTKPEYKGI